MSEPLVSICVPVCRSWNAICLCIESIEKKTPSPAYKILVNDQSKGLGEGNRLRYLRKLSEDGKIELYEENYYARADLTGHGKGIKTLLEHVDTKYAFLGESDIEVIKDDWLTMLINRIENDYDTSTVLGVGSFKMGGNHWDIKWIAPRYIPAWMLLNMSLYRKFEEPDDWDCSRIPYPLWPHKEIFEGLTPPQDPENDPVMVFRDTGWRLYEKLTYDERFKDLRIISLPSGYVGTRILHYGGIDRNSFRGGQDPYIQKYRNRINARLALLRKE